MNIHQCFEHGGNVWEASRKYGFAPSELVDFSANINFLGPPPGVMDAIRENLHFIVHYPDPRARLLRKALAAHLGVNEECIIPSNGAMEVIQLLGFLPDLRSALIPCPTFSEYELAMKRAGVVTKRLMLKKGEGFKVFAQNVIASLQGIDLLFLCNPNNPTGRLIEEGELREVIAYSQDRGIKVILDESFIDFVPDGHRSLASEVERYPHLLVIYSLTKFFTIPGLRLGCGVANSELVHLLEKRKDPWSVNLLAHVAGIAALEDKGYISSAKEAIIREKEFLHEELSRIPGLYVYPSSANFFLIEILSPAWDSQRLTQGFARRGILIRDCFSWHCLGRRFVRVSVRSRKENLRLLRELETLLH